MRLVVGPHGALLFDAVDEGVAPKVKTGKLIKHLVKYLKFDVETDQARPLI